MVQLTPGARKVLAIEPQADRLAEMVAALCAQTAEQAAYIRALEKALSPGYVRQPREARIECKNIRPGFTLWLTEAEKAAMEAKA